MRNTRVLVFHPAQLQNKVIPLFGLHLHDINTQIPCLSSNSTVVNGCTNNISNNAHLLDLESTTAAAAATTTEPTK